MIRLHPNLALFFLTGGILIFALLNIINFSGLQSVSTAFFRWYVGFLALVLLWWPVDMFLHWEKKTSAAIEKDKYIAMLAVTVILFIFPYYWFFTPLWPTVACSVSIGLVIPSIFIFLRYVKSKIHVVNPSTIYRIGMKSPRAQEFLEYFPDAKQYVFGTRDSDSARSHLILHKRVPCDALEDSYIDFVMDISVDRRLEIFIGGKEKLECYLFRNDGNKAGIGFLPSSNIGRSLDYGFSEDELEKAAYEASSLDHQWASLGEEPLIIQHYPGKAVKLR